MNPRSHCRTRWSRRAFATTIGDTLLLLEHPHVLRSAAAPTRVTLLERDRRVPVHRVSRGGQVTYHGPGQIVGYPIVKLEGRERDVHRYLRELEQAMIAALAKLGIAAGRRDGLTGVWVGARKIGSIGVGIRRWVTLHGFALNVTHRPRLLRRDRAVRHRGMRDDVDHNLNLTAKSAIAKLAGRSARWRQRWRRHRRRHGRGGGCDRTILRGGLRLRAYRSRRPRGTVGPR